MNGAAETAAIGRVSRLIGLEKRIPDLNPLPGAYRTTESRFPWCGDSAIEAKIAGFDLQLSANSSYRGAAAVRRRAVGLVE